MALFSIIEDALQQKGEGYDGRLVQASVSDAGRLDCMFFSIVEGEACLFRHLCSKCHPCGTESIGEACKWRHVALYHQTHGQNKNKNDGIHTALLSFHDPIGEEGISACVRCCAEAFWRSGVQSWEGEAIKEGDRGILGAKKGETCGKIE